MWVIAKHAWAMLTSLTLPSCKALLINLERTSLRKMNMYSKMGSPLSNNVYLTVYGWNAPVNPVYEYLIEVKCFKIAILRSQSILSYAFWISSFNPTIPFFLFVELKQWTTSQAISIFYTIYFSGTKVDWAGFIILLSRGLWV